MCPRCVLWGSQLNTPPSAMATPLISTPSFEDFDLLGRLADIEAHKEKKRYPNNKYFTVDFPPPTDDDLKEIREILDYKLRINLEVLAERYRVIDIDAEAALAATRLKINNPTLSLEERGELWVTIRMIALLVESAIAFYEIMDRSKKTLDRYFRHDGRAITAVLATALVDEHISDAFASLLECMGKIRKKMKFTGVINLPTLYEGINLTE